MKVTHLNLISLGVLFICFLYWILDKLSLNHDLLQSTLAVVGLMGLGLAILEFRKANLQPDLALMYFYRPRNGEIRDFTGRDIIVDVDYGRGHTNQCFLEGSIYFYIVNTGKVPAENLKVVIHAIELSGEHFTFRLDESTQYVASAQAIKEEEYLVITPKPGVLVHSKDNQAVVTPGNARQLGELVVSFSLNQEIKLSNIRKYRYEFIVTHQSRGTEQRKMIFGILPNVSGD